MITVANSNYIRLSQWAAQHGMHRMTAWRHANAGTLPTELQPKKTGNIIYVLTNPGTPMSLPIPGLHPAASPDTPG